MTEIKLVVGNTPTKCPYSTLGDTRLDVIDIRNWHAADETANI